MNELYEDRPGFQWPYEGPAAEDDPEPLPVPEDATEIPPWLTESLPDLESDETPTVELEFPALEPEPEALEPEA